MSTRRSSFEQETRQFKLLARDSVRQILASATMARDADPAQVALWATALALTPPFVVSVRKVLDYPFLLRAPAEYVERVVLADRLFFVLYGMLATALVTALLWDALSPTRHDHEVTGSLPVRPRTVAAARLAAAVGLLSAFALAITLPSALLYSAASAVHPLVGAFPRVLVAHLLASMLGCVFVFASLLAVRTLVIVSAGDALASRLAVVLQAGTFVCMVQVFFFLPGILPELLRGQELPGYAGVPPLWYAGLFSWLADGRTIGDGMSMRAGLGTGLAMVAAVVTGIAPARLLRRRALERRADVSTRLAVPAIRVVARHLVHARPVRALLMFAVASLFRSRRHAVILATYGGLAIAMSVLGMVTRVARGSLVLEEPRPYTLAIPLILMFFAVLGLRAACAVPVDLDANWPLRMHQLSARISVAATRLFLIALGMLPIVAGGAITAAWLWGWSTAVTIGLVQATAGAVLVEMVLTSWTTVPFASAHEPAVDAVQSRWARNLVAMFSFGYVLAAIQVACLPSTTSTAVLLAVLTSCLALTAVHGRRGRAGRPATFEAESDSFDVLRLSAALD